MACWSDQISLGVSNRLLPLEGLGDGVYQELGKKGHRPRREAQQEESNCSRARGKASDIIRQAAGPHRFWCDFMGVFGMGFNMQGAQPPRSSKHCGVVERLNVVL